MPIGWAIWLPLMLCLFFGGQLFVILLAGPENGSAMASLILTLGFAILTGWQFRQRRVVSEASDAERRRLPIRSTLRPLSFVPSAALPSGVPVERRQLPRFPVDWTAEIVWHHAGREHTRLHDLSRGGARLACRRPEATGRRGLLLVRGLKLPVPFTIVGSSSVTGLHVRFDLEGMGLDELEQQLQGLTSVGDGAAQKSSGSSPGAGPP